MKGELPPGFRTGGFRSHCDYGIENCVLRVNAFGRPSKLHLTYSVRSSTVPLEWTLLGARATWYGFSSSSEPRAGVSCLCSQVIALTPEMTAVSLLLTGFSVPEWELPVSMVLS